VRRKVVAYIRVSTDEQASHGYSIETQRQLLKDYARGHDLQIVLTVEETHSAHKPGRPKFQAMLAFLRKHTDVRGVLVYKLDRLSRNMSDYSILEEMEGIEIISVTEALPAGASGRFVASIHAAVSRLYSDQLGERVRHAARTKVKKGGWPGPAPTGYRNDTVAKRLISDPEMAEIVIEVFETYARQDISLSRLVRFARDRGLRTRKGGVLGKSSIHHILKHPIYYGVVRWEGVLYEGNHEPLISKALFDRVQDLLRAKSSPLTKHNFPYRGLLKCGYCGCSITASLEKGKYIYYHCTHGRGPCKQPYVRQEVIGDMLLPIVQNVHLSREQVTMLLDMMHNEHQRQEEEQARRLRRLQGEQAQIRRRRDAAYEDKLDGKISEERWLELERDWSAKANTVKQQIVLWVESQGPAVDEAQATFELLERAPVLYMKQSDEEKARLLKTLLSNCWMKREKPDPIYRKPFDLVAIGLQTGDWLPG